MTSIWLQTKPAKKDFSFLITSNCLFKLVIREFCSLIRDCNVFKTLAGCGSINEPAFPPAPFKELSEVDEFVAPLDTLLSRLSLLLSFPRSAPPARSFSFFFDCSSSSSTA
jgi:hypothetical protein